MPIWLKDMKPEELFKRREEEMQTVVDKMSDCNCTSRNSIRDIAIWHVGDNKMTYRHGKCGGKYVRGLGN